VRANGHERMASLADVESLLASSSLIVDACRYVVRAGQSIVSLARRPVLFALAQALGEAWPGDVTRAALIARAFGGRHADESHRARLRVEMGRLRSALRGVAGVHATRQGFALTPFGAEDIVVITGPVEATHPSVLALLADGEAWSSSALALASATSQRSIQRALDVLAEQGRVQAIGRGRSRRWMSPPLPGFATTLLLPALLPAG